MYAEERRRHIHDLLGREKRVDVASLAESLHISTETVRRDLRDMESAGLLKRTHGGAICANQPDARPETPIGQRIEQKPGVKSRIAARAATLVRDGDVIALDNSSTVCAMLQAIPDEYALTIITNSIPVVDMVTNSGNERWQCICLGGPVSHHSQSTFGPLAWDTLAHFRPGTLFMSCAAMDWSGKLTEGNFNDAELKHRLLAACQSAVLLIDRSKFGLVAAVNSVDIDAFTHLVTDGPDDGRLAFVQAKGVTVHWAE